MITLDVVEKMVMRLVPTTNPLFYENKSSILVGSNG